MLIALIGSLFLHQPTVQAGVSRTCAVVVPTGKMPGYQLTTLDGGVRFDANGDGELEQTPWIDNVYGAAFLVVDRNNNGVVDNGKELVGGQMLPEAASGIAALDRLSPRREGSGKGEFPARHNDAYLDSSDAIWSRMFLWRDLNRNGKSETGELRPLGDIIARIGLGYSRWNKADAHGNVAVWQGWVELNHPLSGEPYRHIYDVACRAK